MNKALVDHLRALARIDSTIHGPAHWARVVQFGTRLARIIPLSREETFCVQLFGWTHDLARLDDGMDPQHGPAGARYLAEVIETTGLEVPEGGAEVVARAIRHHSDGVTAGEAARLGWLEGLPWERERALLTIGACWDADRLDLLRLGMEPLAHKMSTPGWAEVAAYAYRVHGWAG